MKGRRARMSWTRAAEASGEAAATRSTAASTSRMVTGGRASSPGADAAGQSRCRTCSGAAHPPRCRVPSCQPPLLPLWKGSQALIGRSQASCETQIVFQGKAKMENQIANGNLDHSSEYHLAEHPDEGLIHRPPQGTPPCTLAIIICRMFNL